MGNNKTFFDKTLHQNKCEYTFFFFFSFFGFFFSKLPTFCTFFFGRFGSFPMATKKRERETTSASTTPGADLRTWGEYQIFKKVGEGFSSLYFSPKTTTPFLILCCFFLQDLLGRFTLPFTLFPRRRSLSKVTFPFPFPFSLFPFPFPFSLFPFPFSLFPFPLPLSPFLCLLPP